MLKKTSSDSTCKIIGRLKCTCTDSYLRCKHTFCAPQDSVNPVLRSSDASHQLLAQYPFDELLEKCSKVLAPLFEEVEDALLIKVRPTCVPRWL